MNAPESSPPFQSTSRQPGISPCAIRVRSTSLTVAPTGIVRSGVGSAVSEMFLAKSGLAADALMIE